MEQQDLVRGVFFKLGARHNLSGLAPAAARHAAQELVPIVVAAVLELQKEELTPEPQPAPLSDASEPLRRLIDERISAALAVGRQRLRARHNGGTGPTAVSVGLLEECLLQVEEAMRPPPVRADDELAKAWMDRACVTHLAQIRGLGD